jgi:hypothetical protein
MTHDELLAKIADLTLGVRNAGLALALISVVELHQCSNPRFDLLCDCGRAYPCPTIQAIEKELQWTS